jgi:hypothetical protein
MVAFAELEYGGHHPRGTERDPGVVWAVVGTVDRVPHNRRLVLSWVVLLIWTVFILWWATSPVTDTVGLLDSSGGIYADADGAQVTVDVECPAPVDFMAAPPGVALPDGAVPTRPLCTQIRANGFVLFFDVAIILLVGAVLAFIAVRSRRDEQRDLQESPPN